jgi:hypothetical protein
MIGGALLSAGGSAGIQKVTRGSVNYREVAVAGVIGAGAGGLGYGAGALVSGASKGASLGRLALAGGVESVSGGMADRGVHGGNVFNPRGIAADLLTGGAAPSVGHRLGGDAARIADDVAPPRYVYRGGSASDANLTPRPGIDHTGLSTYDNIEAATPPGGKAQVIDTTRMRNLAAHPDSPPPGHVSIRPHDPSEVSDWAASRGADETHPYTQELRDAIVGVERRPK